LALGFKQKRKKLQVIFVSGILRRAIAFHPNKKGALNLTEVLDMSLPCF